MEIAERMLVYDMRAETKSPSWQHACFVTQIFHVSACLPSTVSVGVTYRFECVDKFVNMMVNTSNKD